MLFAVAEPASEYVISLRAFNQVGQGVPELENVRTREATSEFQKAFNFYF